jgi:hypothetical protein
MRRIDRTDEMEYHGQVHRCLYYEIRKNNLSAEDLQCSEFMSKLLFSSS